MSALRLFVEGIPAPGGSKTIGRTKAGRMFIRDAGGNRNTKWKKVVKDAAKQAMRGRVVFSGPVALSLCFKMPRPKCHYRSGKYADQLRPDAPRFHVVAPDATKLTRSTEDAMKGVVWVDDCQVVRQEADKTWAERGTPAGAWIVVTPLQGV